MAQESTTPSYIDEDFLNPWIPVFPQPYPSAQALGAYSLHTNTDIEVTGVFPWNWTYGIPSPQNWFPPLLIGTGINTPGFTLPNQPYGFLPVMSPASIVPFGSPTSDLGSYGTTYVNESMCFNDPFQPTDEDFSGIYPAVSRQPREIDLASQGYQSPALGTEISNVYLDGGKVTTESNVLSPGSFDGGTSPMQSFDDTLSDWHGATQTPEYIDLTRDDGSDADRSETSTPWNSPLQCSQPRNSKKRQRDGVDDLPSSSPLGNSQKRRCMRQSPRRPAKHNELILDVRTILHTNENGNEVESEFEHGRWTFPIHQDDITAIKFAVNSGNWTNLTFQKVDDSGWWITDDVDGWYMIFLSDCDITLLIESPKEACYLKYGYYEY
ncbi:hypothetical protein SNK04_013583 [Fusarium graminearum]